MRAPGAGGPEKPDGPQRTEGTLRSEAPQDDLGFVLPRIPASAGALVFDRRGRLLVVNPTYKAAWTIPGGIMESDGETPWEACRREVREEVGLEVTQGRLAAVDFLRPKPGRPGGIRFLFDCGAFDDAVLGSLALQADELSAYRLVKPKKALDLLSGPLRRRVRAALGAAPGCVYLEEGKTITAVSR